MQKWPGNSFTFHAWVCLGPVDMKERKEGRRTSAERKIFHYRRNLYRLANQKMNHYQHSLQKAISAVSATRCFIYIVRPPQQNDPGKPLF